MHIDIFALDMLPYFTLHIMSYVYQSYMLLHTSYIVCSVLYDKKRCCNQTLEKKAGRLWKPPAFMIVAQKPMFFLETRDFHGIS